MIDPIFSDARLAGLYDAFDGDRADLELYAGLVQEFEAKQVIDVGCGTGSFAVLLASLGRTVVAVDPAVASIELARSKPLAEKVMWITGAAESIPPIDADMVTMTGNVAQVFLTDEKWHETLSFVHQALRPGGHLVFESRRPDAKAWLKWTPEETRVVRRIEGVGDVEAFVEVIKVDDGLVTFTWTYTFSDTNSVLTSDSTIRFRDEEELSRSLGAAGYVIEDVRDAPDRPGLEFVFIAVRR